MCMSRVVITKSTFVQHIRSKGVYDALGAEAFISKVLLVSREGLRD